MSSQSHVPAKQGLARDGICGILEHGALTSIHTCLCSPHVLFCWHQPSAAMAQATKQNFNYTGIWFGLRGFGPARTLALWFFTPPPLFNGFRSAWGRICSCQRPLFPLPNKPVMQKTSILPTKCVWWVRESFFLLEAAPRNYHSTSLSTGPSN